MVCLAVAGSASLAACGQKGALYLPTDPAAKDRATLPQLLSPGGLGTSPSSSSSSSSSSSTSSPAPAPSSLVAPSPSIDDTTVAPPASARSNAPQK